MWWGEHPHFKWGIPTLRRPQFLGFQIPGVLLPIEGPNFLGAHPRGPNFVGSHISEVSLPTQVSQFFGFSCPARGPQFVRSHLPVIPMPTQGSPILGCSCPPRGSPPSRSPRQPLETRLLPVPGCQGAKVPGAPPPPCPGRRRDRRRFRRAPAALPLPFSRTLGISPLPPAQCRGCGGPSGPPLCDIPEVAPELLLPPPANLSPASQSGGWPTSHKGE